MDNYPRNNFNDIYLNFNKINNNQINNNQDIFPNFGILPQENNYLLQQNNNNNVLNKNNNKSFINKKNLMLDNTVTHFDSSLINNMNNMNINDDYNYYNYFNNNNQYNSTNNTININNNQNDFNNSIINNNSFSNNFINNLYNPNLNINTNSNNNAHHFNKPKGFANKVILNTAPNDQDTMVQYNKIFGNLKQKLKLNNLVNSEKEVEMNLFSRNNNYNKNIIYYDESLKKSVENNNNCAYFKLKLKGTFYGVNNFQLFKYICYLIKKRSKKFILICSGSSAKKAFEYCYNIEQIYEYYIYCLNIEIYQPLKLLYPRLKGIFNDFSDLKQALFYNQLNPQIDSPAASSNLIFFEEYNNLFIKFHLEIIRKYSLYKLLKSKNSNKSLFLDVIKKKMPYYLDLARQLLYHDDEAMVSFFLKNTKETEETLRKVFNSKHTVKNYISNYTIEGFYYKYINKFLRQGDFNSYRLLSNHLCKFIYHLYEYRKNLKQERTATLYRKMYISKEELKVYKKSLGKVICYPSFTSTSILQDGYEPTNPNNGSILVKLVIEQNNSKSIISIKDLSEFPNEEEYLCLPFSFFKITMILDNFKGVPCTIYLTALNSEKPLEEMLLEFMETETDNLDLEGLDMIVLTHDKTNMVLSEFFTYDFYSTHVFGVPKNI